MYENILVFSIFLYVLVTNNFTIYEKAQIRREDINSVPIFPNNLRIIQIKMSYILQVRALAETNNERSMDTKTEKLKTYKTAR